VKLGNQALGIDAATITDDDRRVPGWPGASSQCPGMVAARCPVKQFAFPLALIMHSLKSWKPMDAFFIVLRSTTFW